MENVIVEYIILYMAILWIVVGAIRLFFPNHAIKNYISGKWTLPNDNLTRFLGLFWGSVGLYVLLNLLGYIK